MAYETKFTRMTPGADFALESLEQQLQQKMELEQVQQYLKENFPEETELQMMSPEMALEALGSEMLHTIGLIKQGQKEEKKKSEE